MHGFDEFVIQAVAEMRSPIVSRFMLDITSFGSATGIVIQMTLAIILLLGPAHEPRSAVRLGVAAGGTQILSEIIKAGLRSPRPEIVERLDQALGFSHPSGHAAVSTAFYLTLAMILSRRLGPKSRRAIGLTFGILILLIGFSRVYLGVHYPSDVLSGFLLGTLWSIIALKLSGQE
jgi:undecaprenyl-diphosphatase